MRGMFRFLFGRGSCATVRRRSREELEADLEWKEWQLLMMQRFYHDEQDSRLAWERTALSNGEHASRLEAELAEMRRRYENVCILYRMANRGWRAAARRAEEALALAREFKARMEHEETKGTKLVEWIQASADVFSGRLDEFEEAEWALNEVKREEEAA